MDACPTPWKIRYDDRGAAMHFVRGNKSVQLHAYRCGCGGWHLSSMTKRQAKLQKAGRR